MTFHHLHDSSHSLRDLVESRLARSSYFLGRYLRVEVDRDEVTLRGIVRSYHEKQVAQESVREIPGVTGIRNELEVISA